jgi:DNA-binding CsgD family transcriptional regulator
VVQVTDNPVSVAALLQARGVLKVAEGKLEEAIPLLRQAVETWGQLKRRYQQALAAQRLAEVLLAWAGKSSTGRVKAQAVREEAERLLDRALTVYNDLQIPTGRQTVQALRTSTYLEAQQKRRRTLEAHQPWQGLTRREMQVLTQLAAGRTNKEIGEELGISAGTVERHVTHILTKLGCETRTQAAASAIAHGWLTPPR